jgi:FkbM family methyltransferase
MISSEHIHTAVRKLGFADTLATLGKEAGYGLYSSLFRTPAPPRVYRLPARTLRFPLFCRAGSSDLYAYYQIFVEREYDCTAVIERPKLIVDCGANVGYTSAFFLNRYPDARLIAVEPDPDNFAMLERNLHPYGDRARLLNAAVWSHPGTLRVHKNPGGPRREWSTRVSPRAAADAVGMEVEAVDIGRLLADSGQARIDILKIDIEGAEAVVFADHYQAWIDKVDCFVIELHDAACHERFFGALAASGIPYRYSRSGELTVAIREAARA